MRQYQNLYLHRLCMAMALLWMIAPQISSSEDLKEEPKLIYLLVGKTEECLHIDWRKISMPIDSEKRTLPDGRTRLSVAVKMPFLHMALVLKDCDMFALTEKGATKLDTDKTKKIILMQDTRTGFMTEKKYGEVSQRLLALDKRLLYYVKEYDVPDELVKKYGLDDSIVFQDQRIVLPIREGTREFDLELKKYGISLSRSETNIVSQIPPDARDDLPVSAEGGTRQSDEPSPE